MKQKPQEAANMGNLEAVKKYQEAHDAFKLRPTLAEGQQIRAYAAAHNMSVQGLFLEAVRVYMAANGEAPHSEENSPTEATDTTTITTPAEGEKERTE